MPITFNCQRFWVRQGSSYNLDHEGYLADPGELEYGPLIRPEVLATEKLWHTQCVVLLGEPGIGKTTTINDAIERGRQIFTANGDCLLHLDLKSLAGDAYHLEAITNADVWKKWMPGNGLLHLFMDSLDECSLHVPTIAVALLKLLKNNSLILSRLRLRIICRTADLPVLLKEGLRNLFNEHEYEAFELLPLRCVDVASAAKAHNLNPDNFLAAVQSVDAQPLAATPITLKFLINRFCSDNSLPKSKINLYRQGCRHLCEEISRSRQAANKTGSLDPDQRLAVASRIAALMILCKKKAICLDSQENIPNAEVLTLEHLNGGSERAKGNTIEVTESRIREVLGTALFAGRGADHLRFAHQSYAEFLAAEHLSKNGLKDAQIASLLCNRDDTNGRLVPQLSETGAWLAGMSKPFFKRLLKSDPLALLRSDAHVLTDTDRKDLIGAILKQMDDQKINDFDFSLWRYFGRFNHLGLPEQLAPFIENKSRNNIARRTAIRIVEAGALTKLQDLLLRVSLDSTDDHRIRCQASSALGEIGDAAHRKALIQLIGASETEDPDDELRGSAMQALWPEGLISLEQLLAAIAPARDPHLYGGYALFVDRELLRWLKMPTELPKLLNWLSANNLRGSRGTESIYAKLSDGAILAAWNCLNVPETRDALGDYLLKLYRECYSILSPYAKARDHHTLEQDAAGRRLLVESIVRRDNSGDGFAANCYWLSSARLIRNNDFEWLLERAQVAENDALTTKFASLARWVLPEPSSAVTEMLLMAATANAAIHAVFSGFLDLVEIDSPQAEAAREQRNKLKELDSRAGPSVPLDPPMKDRVKQWLEEFESGNIDSWCQLNYDLMFDETGSPGGRSELEYDLRKLPGWATASIAVQERIVSAAHAYLVQSAPKNKQWIGTRTIDRRAFAGFRALYLLYNLKRHSLDGLKPAAWEQWTAIILSFPVALGITGESDDIYRLTAMAYQHATKEFIRILQQLIDAENRDPNLPTLAVLRRLRHCWDRPLCDALLEKARDTTLKPWAFGELLENLLLHDPGRATTLAISAIPLPIPSSGSERDIAGQAAIKLLLLAPDCGWSTVWPAIQSDTAFGRAVFESVASDYRQEYSAEMSNRLTEDQAAELFIWLETQYPQTDDPQFKTPGMHLVGPRELLGNFRNAVLQGLKNRGTAKSAVAIQRIRKHFSKYSWLKHVELAAEEMTRRQTWTPPNPKDVIELCVNANSTLVRHADELQDLLIEVLQEIDADLQGETPSAPALWNQPTSRNDSTEVRPKDENRFSDWVCQQLKLRLCNRGIIPFREVVIRRGEGTRETKSPGERTDIYVAAVTRAESENAGEAIRVIIEAKGCWHSELKTAMKTQLVERYLKDNACRHGIYLVGWFRCNQWDKGDSRRNESPDWTVEDARDFFDEQVKQLPADGPRIRCAVLNTALR